MRRLEFSQALRVAPTDSDDEFCHFLGSLFLS